MAGVCGDTAVLINVSGTGLGALPDQLHAAVADVGFEFNVMVAGG
jgi:hypothetical protein